MKSLPKALVVLIVLFGLCIPLHGQVAARQPEATSAISSLLVTAQSAGDHIRFTALTVGSRIRLEILSQTGDTLYDSSFRPGNLIEWPLADQQGSRLPDGVYGCIVTVEELSGRLTYRRGLFRLADGKISFDAPVPSRFEVASVDSGEESISILSTDDRFPFTFVGHDGTDARIESTAGGLILHAGRFFAGESDQSPHMRLTPDGNLGIGVHEPAAKLDVAGLIRTSEGIQFADGSILKSANGFGSFSIFPASSEGILPGNGAYTVGVGTGPSGRAFDTSRLSKAASGVKQMTAAGGGIGRYNGTEGSSNTFYGMAAGDDITTGKYNSFFGVLAGTQNTTGDSNSFLGNSAGLDNTTGGYNSFFGERAGRANTTGNENAFFGDSAGRANTTASFNSFFGSNAGASNTSGEDNAFFGRYAGNQNSTGEQNSFFGTGAGYSNTTANYNAFFGEEAGHDNTATGNSMFGAFSGRHDTTGFSNAFFGGSSGYSNTTGSHNSFYGSAAGYSNTDGEWNAFFGKEAGYSSNGSQNSFFGARAGSSSTTGSDNSFFGKSAGTANTTGYSNSFFGLDTGAHNTTGFYNSFFGRAAGTYSTTGNSNAFFGVDAGFSNTTGNDNAFFGRAAGRSSATASSNSFFGRDAGYANSTGGENSFFGMQAGLANTTGYNNSFFGKSAGNANTTGAGNAFFGHSAGYSNTTAARNSFFGTYAGYSNDTGEGNAFFGRAAGYTNNGNNNSSFGFEAGYYNTTGENDSFFGYKAGQTNSTESNNNFIGAYSDGAAGITNATAIGYRAKVAQSNSLVLGSINGVNDAAADTYVGIGTTSPDRQLVIEGDQALARFRRYYGTADPFTRTFGPALLFERSRGTRAAPADIQAGDYLGKVQARGRVGGNMLEYGAFSFVASDTSQNGRFAFFDRDIATERVSILNTGNVGIGTTTPTERLHVVGNIRVTGSITYGAPETDIPDYVFEPKYKLMPIDDLQRFIAQEKHLPNIPASAEIKEKGLNLGEFQMRLLEKVEELTLYAMQQERTIREQKTTIDSKEARISSLEARLAAIEQMLLRQQDQRQK